MTTIPAHAECGRADAVIPFGVHGPATKWLCRRCRLTFGEADSMTVPMGATVTDADRKSALLALLALAYGHPTPGQVIDDVAQAIAVARVAENRACEAIMGKVIADNGCDCCDDDGNDFEGPHEGMSCEKWGHEPCLACLMNRACDVIAARRTP